MTIYIPKHYDNKRFWSSVKQLLFGKIEREDKIILIEKKYEKTEGEEIVEDVQMGAEILNNIFLMSLLTAVYLHI